MNAFAHTDRACWARCAPRRRWSPTPCRCWTRTAPAKRRDADHRDLRQGRHRQELHAGQPQLHDGPAGQEGAAHRLRPEERHDLAAVRRQGLPDDHRDLRQDEGGGRRDHHLRRLLQCATACSPWSSAAPRSDAAAAGAASSMGFELLEKLGFHEWGFRLRAARLPRGRGLRRLRPADRPRHVPEGHCRRFQRPCNRSTSPNNVCSAVEYFRKLGGNVGVRRQWSSTRTTTPGRLRPSPSECRPSRSWRQSRLTRTSARRRANYEIIGTPGNRWASVFEDLSRKTLPTRRRCGRSRLTQDGLLGPVSPATFGRPQRGAGTGHDGRHVRAAPT